MKLFSDYFKELLEKQSDYFKDDLIKGAYLIGAYSKSIINSSFASDVSKENKTFEKSLSNQKIIAPNLKKIFNKANEFERKLKLGSATNSDLLQLITTHFCNEKSKSVSRYEISFAFIRGMNDYVKFKKDNQQSGENNE